MWDTFACATAIFLTHFIISIAVLENVPPYAGLQKRATFSTLKVWPGPGIKPGPPAWQAAALTAQPSTTPNLILPLTPLLKGSNNQYRELQKHMRKNVVSENK
jgi:hypothetical protein